MIFCFHESRKKNTDREKKDNKLNFMAEAFHSGPKNNTSYIRSCSLRAEPKLTDFMSVYVSPGLSEKDDRGLIRRTDVSKRQESISKPM